MNPLSPSLVAAAAKRLIDPRATRQGGLAALRDMSRQGRLSQQVVRGPAGELYMFPTEASLGERASWDPLRELIDETFLVQKGRMPSRKAADAERLAGTLQDAALPRSRIQPSVMDAISASLDPQGTSLKAVSGWGGRPSTGNADLMFLYDLVADPSTKGEGYRHLKSVLEGPMMPDASRVFFTPLKGAKQFYKDKFGAQLLSPNEALNEDELMTAIELLGQERNVKDLGLGVINRRRGGLARMRECGCA